MPAISLSDLASGRTTTYATPFTHPVGTRLVLRLAGCATRQAIIWAYTPDKYCYGGVQAKVVVENSDGSYRLDNLSGNILHKYNESAGIGYYEGRDGRLQIADKEELDAALANATDTQNAENEKRRLAMAEAERIQEAGRNLLHLLGDSPAVIIAVLIKDESDLSTDYFGHTRTKTVILARSKSTRVSFAEMRKAALNSADHDIKNLATSSEEHRETYSMGAGMFLTAEGKGCHSNGWQIRKVRKWSDKWDGDIIKALGLGNHCLTA